MRENKTEDLTVDGFIKFMRDGLNIEFPFDEDTPLLSSGLIDSFDVVALLSMIEGRYGVSIPPEEIDAERFDTPRQMLARLQQNTGK